MKKILVALLFTSALLGVSCSKSDDSGNGSSEKTYTIKFTGTENVNIEMIAIAKQDGTTETYTDVNKSSWEKQIKVEGVFSAGAVGLTTDEQSGKLEAQIIENGKVIKTSTSEGTMLNVTVSNM